MGDESAAMLERHFMLSSLGSSLERSFGGYGLFVSRDSFTWLCTKNPEQEYKKEAFNLFVNMLGVIKADVVTDLSRVHVPTPEELAAMEAQQSKRQAEAMQLKSCHMLM